MGGKPNQLETALQDGTKVMLRRDVDEYARPIGKKYPQNTDHYNLFLIKTRIPLILCGITWSHYMISKTILIDLRPDNTKLESFEIEDENLMEINVMAPGEKKLQGKGYTVHISLSVDAMLGLGTELIRKAYLAKERNLKDGSIEELHPAYKELISQNMGVYLTPESASLFICMENLGKVEDMVINTFK